MSCCGIAENEQNVTMCKVFTGLNLIYEKQCVDTKNLTQQKLYLPYSAVELQG